MNEKHQYLVIVDVPGIKEYVFGTDRLVEIRGASALLDHLNRVETNKFLEEMLGESNVECVFSNGGSGQFIIKAVKGELIKALEDLMGYFFQQSKGGLRLVYGIAELSGTNYPQALEQASLRLQKEKDENPFISGTSLHTGYVRECESCSSMASEFMTEFGRPERILCTTCVEKVNFGKKRGLWRELAEYFKNKGKDLAEVDAARPESFEEIGELCQAKKGYTALVYADGNAMGRLIKRIENKDQFQFFSTVVDQSIREACHEAIYENCSFTPKIPADILLLGGDDLLVYLAADTALPFAINTAQKFAQKTQERFSDHPFFANLLKRKGITISFGIAYGKSHTPFAILLDQAEELLRSAKKAGSLDPRAEQYFSPTYIDYHLTSHFNQVQVDVCRKNHFQIHGKELLLLYQKPYSLEDILALLDHARTLVYKGVPRSRLKRFGYAPLLGKVNATLECLKLYTRIHDHDQKLAVWQALDRFGCWEGHLPWKSHGSYYTTILVDLIELTEFITREEGE